MVQAGIRLAIAMEFDPIKPQLSHVMTERSASNFRTFEVVENLYQRYQS
jgi:hypothetical protein